jgi:hypothetical protein
MEIWCGGDVVAERDFGRSPEVGDILQLVVAGETEEYVVTRKAVFYDNEGEMTGRLYVERDGP